MWKYLSRGIRETLERRINFSRKDKAAPQERPVGGALQNKLIPGSVSTHTFNNGTADLGGSCKSGSCNDKDRQNREHHSEKWRHSGGIQQPTLLGALGWSGVMVLGWYLCHPVCRHRRAQPPELEQLKSRARLPHQHTEYMSLFGILSSFALAQPLNILPKRVVEHVPLSRRLSVPRAVQQQSSTISVDVTDSTEDSASEQPKFGPITAEEALDEAADSLTQAQNTVISGIENRLGVACMQLGKYEEAHTYFRTAVELGCAPGAFNLGLCYEIGAGTPQNLKLAAKYYELASSWGHATAMYNLGVFYVHGWGGVPVDCDRARQLFVAAAKLGQSNAQEALSMVPPAGEEDVTVHNSDTESSEPAAVSCEPRQTNILYQILGIMKLRQPVKGGSETLGNVPSAKPDTTKPLYQALGSKDPEAVGNKVGKTVHESDNKEEFNLHNELNISNNVAIECKDLTQFSIIC